MPPGREPDQSARLLVAVLTWNGLETTRACLASLRTLRRWPVPVVVVDNGSQEPEGERLAEESGPPVRAIRLDPNRGVPGGYNAGLAAAAAAGASHVLLMNNDTLVIDPDMLDRLLSCAGVDVAAVAPLTLESDGRVFSAGGELSWWTGLSRHRRVPRSTHQPYEAAWLDGPCLLVSLEAYRRVGGFDEVFVTYWEDVDWCVRARRAGLRLLVEPRTRIVHLRGRTNTATRAEAMHLRNRILFMRRHGGRIQNLVSGAFLLTIHLPAFLARRAAKGRLREAAAAAVEAVRWNLADAWAMGAWRRPVGVARREPGPRG